MLAGRACSLGDSTGTVSGLRERRNRSSNAERPPSERPPLSPWCNAATHCKLSHPSLLADCPQVICQVPDDSLPASAAQLQTAHTSVQPGPWSQPSSMFTEVAGSHTERSMAPTVCQRPLIQLQRDSSSVHGSHMGLGFVNQAHVGAAQQLNGRAVHSKAGDQHPFTSLSLALPIPASSPGDVSSMEVDSTAADSQQQGSVALTNARVNQMPDLAQSCFPEVTLGSSLEMLHSFSLELAQTSNADLTHSFSDELAQTSLPDLAQSFSPPCSSTPLHSLAQSAELSQMPCSETDRRRSFSPLSSGPASALPTTENSETGLPSISCSTLAQLLTGQHSFAVSSLQMVDCRSDQIVCAILLLLGMQQRICIQLIAACQI